MTWMDKHTPAPIDDPSQNVHEWELTDRERRIWEAGYITGYNARQPEIDKLDAEADRLYRAAYDQGGRPS